ncbi:MAG: ribosome maturation factor RimM [Bacteroidota bacterium]
MRKADRPAGSDAGAGPDELILMGEVVKSHGVRGELKVRPITDDPTRFSDLDVLYVGADATSASAFEVTGARFQQGKKGLTLLLKLAGVTDIDAADALRKKSVFAVESDLPLDDDEYFIHDLIGLRVETVDGEDLGVVSDIVDNPAHEILLVRRPNGAESLIPVVDEFIADLDFDAEVIRLDLPEGLV